MARFQCDPNAGPFSPIETLKAEIDAFITDCLGRSATSEQRRAYAPFRVPRRSGFAEMKVFSSFAQIAQLAIDSGIVHSEEPPKPTSSARSDGKDYYFELGEIADNVWLALASRRHIHLQFAALGWILSVPGR